MKILFRWFLFTELLLGSISQIKAHEGDIVFIENKGQWHENVLFKAELGNGTLFVEKNKFTFVLQNTERKKTLGHSFQDDGKRHAYKVIFKNSNIQCEIEGEEAYDDFSNYFIGNDSTKWASNVRHFSSVVFKNLYPDIDLKVYSQNKILKYDLIVNPSGKINDILFEYEGLDGLKLDKKTGNLQLSTSVGEVLELAPYAYQHTGKLKQEIKAKYLLDCNRLQFQVENYNSTIPIVIDPMLIFSSYSGSVYTYNTGNAADNWGYTATYDSKGYTYMAGVAFGNGYPVNAGAFQTNYEGGSTDIAIMKLSPDGTTKIYATYLGGRQAEMPHSMIVNETNELVVFGTTGSDNFPISANAYQKKFAGGKSLYYDGHIGFSFPNGTDIFVSKFSENGTQLTASTYVGGSQNDGLNYRQEYNYSDIVTFGNDSLYNSYGDGARGEIITDDLSNIYIGSCTFSSDFPVTDNAFQKTMNGCQEGIVFKLDYSLSNLIWSSYLGGSHDDAVYSIFTDSNYDLYVTGGTNSTDFPTTAGAYQTAYGGGSADGFICKIAYTGNQLISSSFFGSDAYDQSFFVRLDKDNLVYLVGQTKHTGTNFIKNVNYKVPNGSQFISQLTPDLSQLQWSTVFGSGNTAFAPDLSLSAFGVDLCKRVYVSGWGRWWEHRNGHGTSYLETTPSAYQKTTDGQDFYLLCLNPQAASVNYASFFGEIGRYLNQGNDHVDGGTSRFDAMGTLYQSVCASCGGTQGFPVTQNAYSTHNNSQNCNNAVFRFNINDDFAVANFEAPGSVCPNTNISFTNLSRGANYFWDFGDGQTSIAKDPKHTYIKSGVYTIKLVASVTTGCNLSDTMQKQIVVMGSDNDTLPDIYTCAEFPTQIGLLPSLGMTYQWSPAAYLSNPNISNPYAKVDKNTLFKVIVDNGACWDTISQWVKIQQIYVDAGADITTCSSPQIFTATTTEPNPIYQWSSNRFFTDTLNISSMNQPSAEVYIDATQYFYIRVTNPKTCFGIDSLHVDYTKIATLQSLVNPTCFGSCNGSASAIYTQEAAQPVSYLWGDGTPTNYHNDLCEGEYFVTITDNNGCSKKIKVPITSPEAITNTATITPQPCKVECKGSIEIQTSGGAAPYQYLWNTGETSASLFNICHGKYILQTTDANLCQKTDTFTVPEKANFNIEIVSYDNTCEKSCTGMAIPILDNADSPPYRFEWSNGSTDSIQKNLCAGHYTLIVYDSKDCYETASIDIQNNFTFDSMQVWADRTQIIETQNTVLHATSLNNVSYQWSPSQTLLSPFDSVTVASPQQTTVYYLQAKDQQSCMFTDSVKIEVSIVNCGPPDIKVPNAFTPNGDQNNDSFCINWEWIVDYRLSIFNRWGEKVFETTDPNECWDGKYRDKYCEPGIYMYSLEATCEANKSYKTKGDITLIR